MNRTEHLWSKLREEAGEVAQAVDKLLAFGPEDTNVKNPEGPNNLQRIQAEVIDMLAILVMLEHSGQSVVGHSFADDIMNAFPDEVAAKIRKVIRFAHYAHMTGALDKAPMEEPVPTRNMKNEITRSQFDPPLTWDWQIDAYVGPPGSGLIVKPDYGKATFAP